MSGTQRLKQFVPNLTETVVRFPVPVLSAIILTLLTQADIASITDFEKSVQNSLHLALTAMFFGSGAVTLFFEGRPSRSPAAGHLVALLIAAALGAIVFYDKASALNPVFLLPGLALAIMSAGYIGRRDCDDAFWVFNARVALAIVMSALVVLIFCGGLVAIFASLDYLFEIDLGGEIFQHIWGVGLTLIGPVYGLSQMPATFDDAAGLPDDGSATDRAASALINYLIVPLVVAYVVILHLYAAKIAFAWTLPKGQVGQMVLVFALGGTACFLLSRPWRERGMRLTRLFLTWWWAALIAPLALLAVGVIRRISDYGVTPERYGLVLIGLWTGVLLFLWLARRRRVASWTIVASLSGLLIAASFGPWGASGISIDSQAQRFEMLLQRNGLLDKGRLATTFDGSERITGEDARSGASIVSFLSREKAIDRVRDIFEGHDKNPFSKNAKPWRQAAAINSLFGFNRSALPKGVTAVNFWSAGKASISLPAATHLSGPHRVNSATASKSRDSGGDETRAWRDGDHLVVARGEDVWRINAVSILKRAEMASRTDKARPKPFNFEAQGPAGLLRLLVINANGRMTGSAVNTFNIGFWAALPE